VTDETAKLIEEIRDLKRAYCQVMELTNGRLYALSGAVGGCAIPLWLIVILLAISLWRAW
jgi:hypothetical protein